MSRRATPSEEPSPAAWYDSPRHYDMVYADYTGPETRFIEAMLARHAPPARGPRRILEPACGSGRLLAALAARGHRVAGFDRNDRALDYARGRLRRLRLPAVLWRDELAAFRLPRGAAAGSFDLVHCLVSTFKYLLSEREAAASLRRMTDALRPGGLLLLGLHLADYRRPAPDHERWVARRGSTRVISDTWTSAPDARSRRESMRTVMRIRERGRERRVESVWQFRTYGPGQLRALLRKEPRLGLLACHDFNYEAGQTRGLDLASPDIVLVLSRRG